VTRERETVTDQATGVNMTAMPAVRETWSVALTTAESSGLIFMRKMTAVRKDLKRSRSSLQQARHVREGTSHQDLAVHLRTPALKEKEIARLTMIAPETWCVEITTVSSLAPSSTKRMIAVLSRMLLLPNLSKDARVATSSRDLAVHPRTPALKEKEIARLTMIVLENLSVETTTVSSLVHSITKKMIAV